MDTIWKFLSDLSLLHWLISFLIFLFSGILRYFYRYLKSQFRFGMNLKRTVYFLKTSDDKNLQTQKDKIKSIELFNLEEDIKDISSKLDVLQNLKENSVYIVGYNPNYEYKYLFQEALKHKIPIIIFAKQGEIKKDWDLFNNYIFCDIANTTNRLAIILLNILKIV